MANSELRKKIAELAREFVESVLSAVNDASLAELTSAGGRAGRAAEPSAKKEKAARARKADDSDGRKLNRRDPNTLEKIRRGIIEVLRKSERPIGAAEISRQLRVDTQELSFPLNNLRKLRLVSKSGDRTQAVYTLTEKGRSGEAPEAPPAKAPKAAPKPAKAPKKAAKKPVKKAGKKGPRPDRRNLDLLKEAPNEIPAAEPAAG